MESSMFLGSGCQGGLVPALVRAPLAPVHAPLGLKHFLPFSLEPNHTVHLLPGFTSMDSVHKAVLYHTFGISACSKRKYVSCNVCQIRFNSQSQAVSHYKGTKHAKKLKSLEAPKCKHKKILENGNKEPVRNLSPSEMLQRSNDMKEAPPDPVPPPPDQCSSDVEPKLTPKEEKSRCPTPGAAGDGETESETEEEKALRLLYCSLCKVAVNSASQLDAHNSGTKHKTMLEARSGNGSIKSFPRPGVKSKVTPTVASSMGLQNRTFHCETCDVRVNSETQLKQHISSRRHKDRAAGKPAKPKYNLYGKTQKGLTKQQLARTVKLSLGKDQCPLLPPAIVPSHFAAVAAAASAALGPSFPLRASHIPSLFQTQSLSATLLRPAPGPIRTTHAPVLFAPY